jgi:putative endonuclease
MAGLVPAIHALLTQFWRPNKTWMPGPRPGMTFLCVAEHDASAHGPKPCHNQRMGGWVYIMANRRNGILYVGVTSDLPGRAYQHREGLLAGFTKRYGLKMLVYYEQHDDIRAAIQREKNIKHWSRAWKVRLIHAMNPEWKDLYETLF